MEAPLSFYAFDKSINRTHRAKGAKLYYMESNHRLNCHYVSLKELYERELFARNVSNDNIQYVLNLISESDIDPNSYRMENDYWIKLKEKGLLEVFDEISKAHHIVWNHSNEEER